MSNLKHKTGHKYKNLDPLCDPIQGGIHTVAKLPRMVLTDPAWFFWSMTQGSLISSFDKDLLQELFVKITQIRIPTAAGQIILADYISIPANGLIEAR
jgi:hypothetical protein